MQQIRTRSRPVPPQESHPHHPASAHLHPHADPGRSRGLPGEKGSMLERMSGLAYHPAMAERTFIIGAPLEQSRSFIWQFFAYEGWTCTLNPNGGIHISRGRKGVSIFMGALAGSDFYFSHDVDFGIGPRGETIAVYRSSSGKAMIGGGAIGVHKSSSAHNEYANKLAQALQYQGILLGVQ